MGSTVLGTKKRKITEPHRLPPRPERPRIPPAAIVRMFVIGSISVLACIWAIWRHYAVPRPPLLVPAASSSTGEIEIDTSSP